jgi:hypothetical protein
MSVKDPYKSRKRPAAGEGVEKMPNEELPRDVPKTTKLRINRAKQDEKDSK